jgi:SAM-dependent methyltransferase
MTKDRTEPSYAPSIVLYVTVALVGGGLALVAFAVASTVLGAEAWQVALSWFFGLLLLVLGGFWHSSSSSAYPANLRALEENLLDLLREDWDGVGEALDIGTGSGRLAVPIAREFPQARLTGVDIWQSWALYGLTKERAESNAAIAGVSERCTFCHGSALELPFSDGRFSLVVSAFTFHAIEVPDRTVLFAEAVRVLAPGGMLVVLDLFPRGYGVKSMPEVLEKVQQVGIDDVRFARLKDAGVDLGRLSQVWGMGYLTGRKPLAQTAQPAS